jgi:hypothetical protein
MQQPSRNRGRESLSPELNLVGPDLEKDGYK